MFSTFIIGLTQVFKQLGLPTKLLPVMCLVLGTLLWIGITEFTLLAALEGALLSMSASGIVNLTQQEITRIANKK